MMKEKYELVVETLVYIWNGGSKCDAVLISDPVLDKLVAAGDVEETTDDIPTDEPPKPKKKYKCGKCGQPKAGHVCSKA